MNVLLVIPVFNEEIELAANMDKLLVFLKGCFSFETRLMIADNGSTDGTMAVARRLEKQYRKVKAVHLDLKGRGRAIKTMWSESDADICTYMDVDLSTGLEAFPTLVAGLASGRFDLAIGSRLLPNSCIVRSWKREVISRGYNRLIKLLFQAKFSDAQCGFKGITRRAAERLLPFIEDSGWFFDTELLLLAEKCGYRILELPVKWIDDPDSRVRLFSTIWRDLLGLARFRRNLRRNAYRKLMIERGASSTEVGPSISVNGC